MIRGAEPQPEEVRSLVSDLFLACGLIHVQAGESDVWYKARYVEFVSANQRPQYTLEQIIADVG
jgi:hypothetical protein